MLGLRNLISRLLPARWKAQLQEYFGLYAEKSYSQEGEDMILRRLFENQQTGFYVDVGAHHPKRFSNTYYFYRRGWRGLNIDAMPGSRAKFERFRPKDVNLEVAVAKATGSRTYYFFNEPALNGFDAKLSETRDKDVGSYKIIKTTSIQTRRLEQVLDECLAQDQHIDFLTIDVEGLDYEVLVSNNWSKYRPTVVLVEIPCSDVNEITGNEVTLLLAREGYSIIAKTMNTVIFMLSERIRDRATLQPFTRSEISVDRLPKDV